MSDDPDQVARTYMDIAATGMATMMMVRKEEMPAITAAAIGGDQDAILRIMSIGQVIPHVLGGRHGCVFCEQTVSLEDLAVVAFVGKEIGPGHEALFTLICDACDDPDPAKLVPRLMEKLRFHRITHDGGHA